MKRTKLKLFYTDENHTTWEHNVLVEKNDLYGHENIPAFPGTSLIDSIQWLYGMAPITGERGPYRWEWTS